MFVLYSQNYAARALPILFNTPKKSLLKSSYPKKYLPNFRTQKNPGIKNFKPKKILRSSPSLEISSCLSKVFCSILNTRLLNFSNNNKILHRPQIGFLREHRASEHIFSLRTLIDQHVTHSPRGKLYTCFVDFKKAFDSIWHQGLLYKLLKYNIGGTFYKIISSMYSHSIP